MMADTVAIESAVHDEALGGWTVNGVSVVGGVTRRGPEFVALPASATEADLAAAILAAYAAP